MTKIKTQKIPEHVSAKELEFLFDKKQRTIAEYRKMGLPMHSYGVYVLKDCISWFIKHQTGKLRDDQSRRKPPKSDSKEIELRLLEAKTIKIETENSVRDKELLHIDEVRNLVMKIATIVATGMESLPPRLAPILATIDDPAAIQHLAKGECNNIRRSIANEARLAGLVDE